ARGLSRHGRWQADSSFPGACRCVLPVFFEPIPRRASCLLGFRRAGPWSGPLSPAASDAAHPVSIESHRGLPVCCSRVPDDSAVRSTCSLLRLDGGGLGLMGYPCWESWHLGWRVLACESPSASFRWAAVPPS